MGTNIDGKRKVTIAMTAIKGVGRRYANIVLKKADVDLTKRAGECSEEEVCFYHNFHEFLKLIPNFFFRLKELSQSSSIHVNTKSQIGF